MTGLPAGDSPLIAWYGDDFTGSASVMEVLEFGGIPSVLFLDPPSAELLARFPGKRAIGIAGDARSRSPGWMTQHLPPIYAALRATGARILHYKLCSTFDSSPEVGSIGRAAELGTGDWTPLVVASPRIGRHQAFGTLFAVASGAVVRLDRHPTMSVHPVTPMDEADVRLHLARQTDLPVGLVDLRALGAGQGGAALMAERAAGKRIIAFDVLDTATLAATGKVLWDEALKAPLFALGSQGLEDALLAHWEAGGHVPPDAPVARPVAQIAVVSGSCSPDTARQIAVAQAQGFAALRMDAACAVSPALWRAECNRVRDAALSALSQGQSAMVFTASGPDDPALAAVAEAARSAGQSPGAVNEEIGTGLGQVLAQLAAVARVPRLVIAGGDTSSRATRGLGLVALTAKAAVAPAVPLLLGHAADPKVPPVELVLKGGQMGAPDLFITIRGGKA
jgi:uncharacterized protein YgbK (DUF1537 family)